MTTTQTMSMKQLSEELNVSLKTIYRWVSDGVLVKSGKNRVEMPDFVRFRDEKLEEVTSYRLKQR